MQEITFKANAGTQFPKQDERGGVQQYVAYTIHGTDKTQKVATVTDKAGSLRTKPPGSIENSSTTVVAFSCKDNGRDVQDEISPTLRSMEFHQSHQNGGGQMAIAFTERSRKEGRTLETQDELSYALTNPGAGGRSHCRAIQTQMAVRRLTPRECERLQGFLDDWTRYGLTEDGQIVEISDTQRYQMVGNAVTRNVSEWIGSRIRKNASEQPL